MNSINGVAKIKRNSVHSADGRGPQTGARNRGSDSCEPAHATADDLFESPQRNLRTDKLIDASIQWDERIMKRIDKGPGQDRTVSKEKSDLIERVLPFSSSQADNSGGQRQFHLLWRPALGSMSAEERADKFVDQPRIIAGSHDHRCFKLQ